MVVILIGNKFQYSITFSSCIGCVRHRGVNNWRQTLGISYWSPALCDSLYELHHQTFCATHWGMGPILNEEWEHLSQTETTDHQWIVINIKTTYWYTWTFLKQDENKLCLWNIVSSPRIIYYIWPWIPILDLWLKITQWGMFLS